MDPSKNLSWRHATLGLVLGALLSGGAMALVELATDDPSGPAPGRAPPAVEVEGHDMPEDERCAHMPEHCRPAPATPSGGGAR